MRETLVEFLRSQNGYHQESRGLNGSAIEYLIRPDGTIAAEYSEPEKRWWSRPRQDELALYEQICGRGFPSRLVTTDPTNPGSINMKYSASNRQVFYDYFSKK